MSDGSEASQAVEFAVPEMDCASCAEKITRSVTAESGIEAVDPQVVAGTVEVRFDPGQTDAEQIAAAIERAGYSVERDSDTDSTGADDEATDPRFAVWRSTRAYKAYIGSVALLAGLVIQFLLPSANVPVLAGFGRTLLVAEALYLLGAAVSGEQILRNGAASVRTRSLDIDLLMSLGILGAVTASLGFGESLYLEAGMLAVLFSVAELLETYAMDRARSSMRELVDLSPTTATVLRDGGEETVPVDSLRVGDRVAVKPGDRIPGDGTVLEGESAVDQSPITGESVPVDAEPGDPVYAGTINQDGYLEVRIDTPPEESTLSRIISLVAEAQRERTDHERFVDRFAGYYTPVVVTLAVALVLVPPLVFGLSWATWFKRGLALLVLACPCALVISTPVSVVSAITSAARNGVLIKGGRHLEAMGEVDAVAFDKTGTLTRGDLVVTDVVPIDADSESEVLASAASLEARSEHPIAKAIVEQASEAGVTLQQVAGFESTAGLGVSGEVDGERLYVGKPGGVGEAGLALDHVHTRTDGGTTVEQRPCEHGEFVDVDAEFVEPLRAEGKTVVVVWTDSGIVGLLALADEVRPEAATTVERLHDQGIEHVVMLTGDHQATAEAVGERVGVDAVYADLLPEEKAEVVADLREQYDGIAMVGDGVNDAPALATATVGIAMGAAGTDTAIETADIALMGDDIGTLPYLAALSSRATGVIRQNIGASIGVKALLALGVPFGLVNVAVAVVVGDMGMSLGVTGNALRLAGIRTEE